MITTAFSEFELKKYERVVKAFIEKKRPPPVRNEVDLGYRLQGQSVEIFEIRPRLHNRHETIECAVAKADLYPNEGYLEDLLATSGSQMARL